MQNSTVIKFSRVTLCWLSDAASVYFTRCRVAPLATHPDGRIDRRAQAARRRFNLLLDLTTLALTFFFVC